MSHVLPFEHYKHMLSSEDEDTVKASLQLLFETFVKGNRFPRTKRRAFIEFLAIHVEAESPKVRKWAYHCACFYQDSNVLSLIINQLKHEQNIENIMWALTALSVTYNDKTKLRECVGNRHDEFVAQFSENYLDFALALFGSTSTIDISAVLNANNTAGLETLAKIVGYSELVKDKFPSVTEAVIREMSSHSNADVREYAYWALALARSRGDYINQPDDQVPTVRKHQIALQIENGNKDYVIDMLNYVSNQVSWVSNENKIGVIRGLSIIEYDEEYVVPLISWYGAEISESICLMLLDYFLDNCIANRDEGSFFDIIRDSLQDDSFARHIQDSIICSHKYGLIIQSNGVLDYALEGGQSMSITIKGDSNNIAIAKDSSTAVATTNTASGSDSLEKLIKNVLIASKNGLSDEDSAIVSEGLDTISSEAKSEKPKKTVLKTILNSLKAIKGTAEFAAAVTALAKGLGLG